MLFPVLVATITMSVLALMILSIPFLLVEKLSRLLESKNSLNATPIQTEVSAQQWDPWKPIDDNERFQMYKNTRAQLTDFAQKNHDSFEKTMITVCGGAFGLSLTLVGFLQECSVNLPTLLQSAWISFAISLCLMIASFGLSHKSYEREIDLTDDYYFNLSTETNQIRTLPFKLVFCAMIIFYFGMSALTLFATLNLENLMSKQNDKRPGEREEHSNPPKVSPVLTQPSRPVTTNPAQSKPVSKPTNSPDSDSTTSNNNVGENQ